MNTNGVCGRKGLNTHGVLSILRCIDDADRCIKLVRVFLTGLYEVDMVQDDTGWCQVVPGYRRW